MNAYLYLVTLFVVDCATLLVVCAALCSVQMPTKPVRTLEEREAAYAEARLRILGSAVSSDDDVTNNSCDNRFALQCVSVDILSRIFMPYWCTH